MQLSLKRPSDTKYLILSGFMTENNTQTFFNNQKDPIYEPPKKICIQNKNKYINNQINK